jgi:glycosyltransferase involved in cell wall biosynthesis
LKILVVQESDWIKRGPHNTHHIFERLSEEGHEIRIIDYEINWSDDKKHELLSKRIVVEDYHKLRDNARITVIRPPILYITPFNYLSLLHTHKKEIKRQIREFKPDVVIGLGVLNAYMAVNECKKNNIPFVYFILDTLHTLVHERVFQMIAKKVEQYNYRHSDLVISVNKMLREYTIEMGADPNKAIVLPHGIELARFAEAASDRKKIREKYGFKDNDVVLYFMGYLYGFSGLVQVARYLKANILKYPHVKLFIVGEGPIFETLCKLKKELPNNMLVLGWQPYKNIPSIISASDICILPSEINETMKKIVPIKILEYMAAGKPVISTRLPGILKEFGKDNGVLYVDRPEDTIDRSMIAYDSRINDYRLKARAFVEKYDWEDITKDFERKILDILDRRKIAGMTE